MTNKTFSELNSEEFETLLRRMQTEQFGDLTTVEFFTALSALAEVETRETIELTASVKEGQLVLHPSREVPVRSNEIQFGDKRVVIRLASETSQPERTS